MFAPILVIVCMHFSNAYSSISMDKSTVTLFTNPTYTDYGSNCKLNQSFFSLSEFQALEDLYDSTNGDHWLWRNLSYVRWNFTGFHNPCCEGWYGITCRCSQDTPTYSDGLKYNESCVTTVINLPIMNLVGRIPSSIDQLLGLQYFNLTANAISGRIPQEIVQLTELEKLDFSSNLLSASIPSDIGNLVMLHELLLQSNSLNGSIPTSICQLTTLKDLSIHSNYISNTIPNCIGNLASILILDFSMNSLTGYLPSSFEKLSTVISINLSVNRLSGSIPSGIGAVIKTLNIVFSNNSLIGTIPSTIGKLHALKVLKLGGNILTGSIPETIVHCSNLIILGLRNNHLVGDITGLFSNITHPYLRVFAVESNQLKGSLSSLYTIKSLTSISVVSNCFSLNSISASICELPLLQSLVMDGIQTASSCRDRIFNSYYIKNVKKGGIPSCFFNMQSLTLLHLSGNVITGSLPDNLIISSKLTSLSVSHNYLTGNIPKTMQARPWSNLDLSFNYFDGILSKDFYPISKTSNLQLKANRLSGDIPWSLTEGGNSTGNVDILEGNIFSCSYPVLGGTVVNPNDVNDPIREQYECGSKQFDVFFYFYVGLGTLFIIIISIITVIYLCCVKKFSRNESTTQFNYWYKSCWGKEFKYVIRFHEMLDEYRNFCLLSACYFVFILLPTYMILKMTLFGMFKKQYSWGPSIAFMSGIIPAAIIIVLTTTFYFLVVYVYRAKYDSYLESTRPEHPEETKNKDPNRLKPICDDDLNQSRIPYCKTGTIFTSWAITLLVDLLIIGGSNYGYLAVILDKQNPQVYKSLASLTLSLVSSLWNTIALRKFQNWIKKMMQIDRVESFNNNAFYVRILMINQIIIPFVTVAATSPKCFKYAFLQADDVGGTYLSYDCKIFNEVTNTCGQAISYTLDTTFTPPFTYSDQCSSIFVTSYSQVQINAAIICGMINPLIVILSRTDYCGTRKKSIFYSILHYYGKCCSVVKLPTNLETKLSHDSMPKDSTSQFTETPATKAGTVYDEDKATKESSHQSTETVTTKTRAACDKDEATKELSHQSRTVRDKDKTTKESSQQSTEMATTETRTVFETDEAIATLSTNLVLLVLFGSASPLVAIISALSSCSYALFIQYELDRAFNLLAADNFVKAEINTSCKGATDRFLDILAPIIIFIPGIYGIFLFDMIGDEIGLVNVSIMYFTLVCIMVLALVLYLVRKLNCLKHRKDDPKPIPIYKSYRINVNDVVENASNFPQLE